VLTLTFSLPISTVNLFPCSRQAIAAERARPTVPFNPFNFGCRLCSLRSLRLSFFHDYTPDALTYTPCNLCNSFNSCNSGCSFEFQSLFVFSAFPVVS
jgi:hypothetical protein